MSNDEERRVWFHVLVIKGNPIKDYFVDVQMIPDENDSPRGEEIIITGKQKMQPTFHLHTDGSILMVFSSPGITLYQRLVSKNNVDTIVLTDDPNIGTQFF